MDKKKETVFDERYPYEQCVICGCQSYNDETGLDNYVDETKLDDLSPSSDGGYICFDCYSGVVEMVEGFKAGNLKWCFNKDECDKRHG